MDDMSPQAVDEKVAAKFLGVSLAFLRERRMNGTLKGRIPGPAYVKLGKMVRYRIVDLEHWLESNVVNPSESG